ncbi:glycosyltransferase family 4 protein [Enemella evansiae]|uniref:glycosyltransferase family 4 protein n=1 Tax=Enemella evansiae TaxID=2016499 RepID=UPI00117DECD2|nr:glycosyltransferase family 4 protein [Enemella evansiae]
MAPRLIIAAGPFFPARTGGGPVKSLMALAVGISQRGDEVTVLAADRDAGDPGPYPEHRRFSAPRVTVDYIPSGSRADQLIGIVRTLWGKENYTLYVNSLFSPTFGMLPLLLARLRLTRPHRVVLATRGQFMRNALAHHARRKQLFLPFIRGVLFRGIDLFHVTSQDERQELRSWAPAERIRFIPNTRLSRDAETRNAEPGHLTYVGRVVPIKNVHVIFEALTRADRPLTLTVVGPEEDPDYAALCRAREAALPNNVTVEWRGTLDGEQIAEELSRTEVFVHPTQGENFGHAIAEALEAGCPVVIGVRTPWTEPIRSATPPPGVVLDDPNDADAVWTGIRALLDRDERTRSDAELSGRDIARLANGSRQFEPYAEMFFGRLGN